jgi:RNA polymerase sigma-70 factor (ECF subfamily)
MYSIARNTLKDGVKSKASRTKHDDIDDIAERIGGGITPEEQYEKKQARLELQRAMGKLTEDEREILTLSRFQELKHQEIAEILNISEGAVKARVHRAMKELKNIYLKKEC